MLIYLDIVDGCLHDTMVKLSSCDIDHMVKKANNIYTWPFTENVC